MNYSIDLGRAQEIPADVDDTRIIPFIASTSDKDRHGTVVNQDGWVLDHFKTNPIIGYQHDLYGGMCDKPDPDDVIGKGLNARVEDGKLMVDIEFEPESINPKAEKIFQKVKNKSLNTVSVGFQELGKGNFGEGEEARGGTDETYYFEQQELLEVSVVNLPSNRQALQKSYTNATIRAIAMIRQTLGIGFGDIEQMTVKEVVARLENPNYQKDLDELKDLKGKHLHKIRRLQLINKKVKQ